MADVVTPQVRSRMMSGIRSTNTKPELVLRKGLHAEGFRFRLHDRKLPGTPDLVFPHYKAVLQAHGCFWHGHNCLLFKWPSTRKEFWRTKINRNREVDARAESALLDQGWRVGIVWECSSKGPARLPPGKVIATCSKWLCGKKKRLEVRGRV